VSADSGQLTCLERAPDPGAVVGREHIVHNLSQGREPDRKNECYDTGDETVTGKIEAHTA